MKVKDIIRNWSKAGLIERDDVYKRELLLERVDNRLRDAIFPMARNISARTLAMDLVSVQPLSAPTNTLFYLDYNCEPENLYKRTLLVEKVKKYKTRRSRRGGRRGLPPWNVGMGDRRTIKY